MSTKTVIHNGVKYIDRREFANVHSIFNATRGGAYIAEHGISGWHLYPANPTNLKHTGYCIGTAQTLAEIPEVLYAFEY